MEPDDLYGLPLERFVPERSALAKGLRAEGRREEAARVAKLRKPSVAAWAVNQVVRTQRREVKELFDAGDAVRKAQADVMAGRGDGHSLRAARERERAAVDGLVDAGRGLLTSQGHELSPAVLDRVGETLHASALDEGAREKVRDGHLEREVGHVGLGLGEGAGAAPKAPTTKARPKRGAARKPTKSTQAKEKRAERERAAARKAARAAETTARRRAERAARALHTAEHRAGRAGQALDEANAALAAAREEAEAAADAHRAAKADVEDA
jgi:hypothetical protein